MPEIAVENPVCDACGADIRPGTRYCYNCGEVVAVKTGGEYQPIGTEEAREADQKTVRSDNGSRGKTNEAAPLASAKPTIEENRPLKSAAAIRRRAKAFERKPIEVVWEEREKSPGVIFVVVTVLLLLFAIAVVVSAVFIR